MPFENESDRADEKEQMRSEAQHNGPAGVIIANTGSPDAPTPEAVYAYLAEFLMDDRIVQLPRWFWKLLVTKAILPKRQYTSAQRYRTVWMDEGSPLIVYEQRLAAKLERALRASGCEARVRIGMSYGQHSLADACRQLKEEGCRSLTVLPAYPQSAYCITGSVRDSFQRTFPAMNWDVPTAFVDHYGDDRIYCESVADTIRAAGYGEPGDRILFDFHSIPLKDRRAGDTYVDQIRASVEEIAAILNAPAGSWAICYSSVFGPHPEHWMGPLARDVLPEWGRAMAAGQLTGRVFFTTPGFSADCLETLWDIPHELEPAFTDGGGDPERFITVPPLNDSDCAVNTFLHVLRHHVPDI